MSDKGMRLLVIDDEPQIRKLLGVLFKGHGFEISEAATGLEGINQVAVFKPDVIIVDLGLPDIEGKEVVAAIREWSQTPIIVLTAHDQEQEKIAALDAGADDYVTKPFSTGELMARIRVSLRRSAISEHEPVLTCGQLTIDLAARRVAVGEKEIRLTPTEYELIKILAQHQGRVLTHTQLLKAAWGNTVSSSDTHYLRVYVGQLRKKIEENPTQPRYIITEPGIGYRLMGSQK